jgi:flagellar biosynthesis protein FlhA
MDWQTILTRLKTLPLSGLGAPVLLMMMLSMVMIPMPPFLLDLFFTFNIAFSMIVLMVTIYARRPLDFNVFPSIILIATLMRLSLNIASTRVILLEGHNGSDAAGQVIDAFGNFVIGGNYAVGLIVFVILVIINFSVVTKGAGRVSEVSARFTLDAMPGKQMAIDADLNAGLLTQEAARTRREDISREADFYGAMDGASKFVRGDAVAGILITVINVVGGLIVGIAQHDMAAATAAETYTLLTIGDGLVAQIPSLILSVGTAILVTRVSDTDKDMGEQVVGQMFQSPQALGVTAAIIGLLGIIPGMPNFVFLLLSGLLGAGAYWIYRQKQQKIIADAMAAPPEEAGEPEKKELSWDDVQTVDIIGLEVGYRLIPLVDKNQGGELLDRIKGIRKKLSQELGFLIPPVHIKDNLDLNPNAYNVTMSGVNMGEGSIYPEREMAINPGEVYGTLNGVETKDPAFGLDAVWIEVGDRDQAQTMGYTVVDSSTVVATHISQILGDNSSNLLGHEEVQQIVDKLSSASPKLVENLIPKQLSLVVLLKILQNLLKDHIPIRDMRTIAETLAEYAGSTQDAGILTAYVRQALGRAIVQEIVGNEPELPVITLDANLEQILLQSAEQSPGGVQLGIDPQLAEQIHTSLSENVQQLEIQGMPAVLLVAPQIRNQLGRLYRYALPALSVLSYSEVPDDRQIKVVATVGQQQ